MIRNNDDIWKAGAFNDKRSKPIQLCDRSRLYWKGVFTVVERILLEGRNLVIVVGASGTDCRNPTQHDLTNIALATVIVLKQRRFRRYKHRVKTYLEFATGALALVDVDVTATEMRMWNELTKPGRPDRLERPIMSAVLSFVMKQR